MAEWLCRGLQILVQRFDSASGLQDWTIGIPFVSIVARSGWLCYKAHPAPTFYERRNGPLIPGSSVVEQAAVNRLAGGSNPSPGANCSGGWALPSPHFFSMAGWCLGINGAPRSSVRAAWPFRTAITCDRNQTRLRRCETKATPRSPADRTTSEVGSGTAEPPCGGSPDTSWSKVNVAFTVTV